jgi:mono/diheme cytochrome c family protein
VTRQLNYIIQGFLLALMIPIAGFVVEKISQTNPVDSSTVTIVDTEKAKQEAPLEGAAYNGKMIFLQKCATCHNLFKGGTGPSILDFEDRGPWSDRKNLYAWIRNPAEFMKKDPYTRELKEAYGSMMTAFPDITDEEIDNVVAYISYVRKQRGD